MIDLDAYARDGFAVLPDFVTIAACEALKARAAELVAGFEPGAAPTAFSTRDQAHASDRYFRDSGGDIRFFVEAEAPGQLNKIGHALHDLDPVFDRFSRRPALAALAGALGIEAPLLLQSMYLFKQPLVGAEVGWHQDATYLRTDPPPGRPRLIGADAMHAWVMLWCGPTRGWIGFDPTNGCITGNGHLFVAMGRDYADVAPMDGLFVGGAGQSIQAMVDVVPEEEMA